MMDICRIRPLNPSESRTPCIHYIGKLPLVSHLVPAGPVLPFEGQQSWRIWGEEADYNEQRSMELWIQRLVPQMIDGGVGGEQGLIHLLSFVPI
jgi:hypothetical protein